MKRFLAFLLAAVMLLSMTACGSTATASGSAKTQEFTDSTGRTVTIPAEITKIAITGPLSQVYILPLAGDMLVGVCNEFSADAALYLPEEIFNKTEIGQLYGGKGEMDLEALLTAEAALGSRSTQQQHKNMLEHLRYLEKYGYFKIHCK